MSHPLDAAGVVLPTAGTTGGPKLVPLSRGNIEASMAAWVRALGLTADDRCLNVMPLWHGGLIANVLASDLVGATVINVPKPSPLELMDLIEEFRPTWLPLPADLARQVLADERLLRPPTQPPRFVRLSKVSLPAARIFDLEQIFRCPVLGSYGMTEAASGPVACETLEERNPSSVGKPIHLEVKIDPRGEILISGPSVMRDYAEGGPPDAFVYDGDRRWLRTGDSGYFDDEGFLFLVGRIRKEESRA